MSSSTTTTTKDQQPPPPIIIELNSEQEGNIVELEENLIFKKIGQQITLQSKPSSFDLRNPPTQPLAVSDHPQSVFLAHSQGFYVTRSKDLIEAAKAVMKNGNSVSVQEICTLDVQIGNVRILAVSKDSSTLAVSVCGDVHFFHTASLVNNKDKEPCFSCSVEGSGYVKDFRWRKSLKKNSFLVLSSDKRLYHGEVGSLLKEVMSDVDAVDWSIGGKYISVAKSNFLSIFSSRFREQFTLSIPFNSCTSYTESECITKVDSVNWIRQDCIVLGCFQITDDGKEEGYLIQMISSKDGMISKASSKPVVLSFDGFAGINDDILPFGCGPHLFVNYLENREIALVANKKNSEQHIILFGWSLDDKQKEASLIELVQEDRCLPRIGLQDNEDDNFIMGFGVDKVSLYEKVEVEMGVQQREFSPYCILFCLTLDGKLLMYYLAGIPEDPDAPKTTLSSSDEEEESSASMPSAGDSSEACLRFEEHRAEGTVLNAKSPDLSQEKMVRKEGSSILKEQDLVTEEPNDYSKPKLHGNDLSSLEKSSSFSMLFRSAGLNQDVLQPHTTNKELRTFGDLPLSLERQQNANFGSQSLMSKNLGSNFEKSSEKPPLFNGSGLLFKDPKQLEAEKPVFASSGVLGTSSFAGMIPSAFNTKSKNSHGSDEVSTEFSRSFQRDGLQRASSGSDAIYTLLSSDELNSKVTTNEVTRVEHSGSRVGTALHVIGTQSSPDRRISNMLNMKDTDPGRQFSVNSSGRYTPIGGQSSSTEVRKYEPESAMRTLQVSSYQGSKSVDPLEHNLQSTKRSSRSPQSSYGMARDRDFSNFGNVKEMAKDLDAMLSCIEEEGGFRDACIVFQKKSVLKIEQGLESLTESFRVLKSETGERLEGIQHLIDQTAQVEARKVYMENITKQASDSQYRDLWNRQKLTPELELKRRQIFKMSQDLTNQLIELERHFHTLELNKFSENSGVPTSRRVLHSGLKSTRDGQAFNRLYNTMSSQLAAAEQLSECLSKQMSVLNIESPSAKRKFVAKELFESIGLAYNGDSFKSPNAKKAAHSPESVKKLPFFSASATVKEQSRRNPSSVAKSFEPETARRRVSLDRSWASFEPPKTTVKRMLLQERSPRVNSNKLSLATNIEGLQQHSSGAQPRDHKSSSSSFNSYLNKAETNRFQHEADQDIQDKAPKQPSSTLPFKQTNNISGNDHSTHLKSSATQVTQRSNLISSLSLGGSTVSPGEVQNYTNESFGFFSDRSSIGQNLFSKSDHSKVDSIPFSNVRSNGPYESSQNQTSSTPMIAPAQILSSPKKSPYRMSLRVPSNLNPEDITQTKATLGSINHQEVNQESSVTEPVKSHNSPFALSASPAASYHKKNSRLETETKEAQSEVSTVPRPVSISQSVPSISTPIKASVSEPPNLVSILPSSSSSLETVKSEATVEHSTDAKVSSGSSDPSSSRATPSLVSSSSFPLQVANQQFLPSISTAVEVKLQVQPTELKPMTPSMGPKPSVDKLNLNSNVSASNSLPSQPDPTSVVRVSTDVSNAIAAIEVKNETSDFIASQEDEMEEEASDTTTDLSLGGFGGFGLGSAPTSATPKPNPFGGTFQNTAANPATPQFNFTVPSGELFKPASFSLQPSQSSQPANQNAFSSNFNVPEPTKSAFGQPAHIGPGQQALGSVLGTFGQSRQLGTSPSTPTVGFGFSSGFGAPPSIGFAGVSSGAGVFSAAASASGGFAGAASGGGGFAGAASGGGGFAGAASAGGGGGFAAAASAGGGGGFGAFSNQQGGGGFSGFGSGSSGVPSSPLFTQMRK